MTGAVVAFGKPEQKNLQSLRRLLTDPDQMKTAIEEMCKCRAWGGMLSRASHQLTHYKDKELASTLTTTNRFLRFLDTPAVAESTMSSSFDMADLNNGLSVFLILPPDRLISQIGLLRLWLSAGCRAITKGGLRA